MKAIIVLSLLCCLFVSGESTCDIPSKFWCDSKEIASECNVLEACAEQLWIPSTGAAPVEVDLYFESLCPGCRQFLTKMLYPTWKKFESTGILKVNVYPYGNAREEQLPSGMWNYTCQHGPDECTGNLIDNCILSHAKDFKTAFPIIYCIESAQDPIDAAKKCIATGGLDYEVINTCAMGKEGNSLEHDAAMKTDALSPKHTFVPWIVLNGMHTDKIQNEAETDLTSLICETYKGTKPSICTKLNLYENLFKRSYN